MSDTAGWETRSPAAGAAGEMTLSGVEHPSKMPGNHQIRPTGGAESGALAADPLPRDPDLAMLVERWDSLPAALKTGITAMVRAAGKGGQS